MRITATPGTSNSYIVQAIFNQFQNHINGALRASTETIKHRIIDRVRELITNAPEVEAIINSDLGKQLGLSDPATAINEIILAIQSSIMVEYEPATVGTAMTFNGGFTIKILRSDYQDVLGTPHSSYITNNGVVIPWLSWLLLAGNAPVIYGFRVELSPHNSSTSRTGAIMVKAPGQTWQVPANYAGTQQDNFLTRALIPLQEELSGILQEEILRRSG